MAEDLFLKYFDHGNIETVDAVPGRPLQVEMAADCIKIQTAIFLHDPEIDEDTWSRKTEWTTQRVLEQGPSVDAIREVLDDVWKTHLHYVVDTALPMYHIFIRVIGTEGTVLGGFHAHGKQKITKAYFFKR